MLDMPILSLGALYGSNGSGRLIEGVGTLVGGDIHARANPVDSIDHTERPCVGVGTQQRIGRAGVNERNAVVEARPDIVVAVDKEAEHGVVIEVVAHVAVPQALSLLVDGIHAVAYGADDDCGVATEHGGTVNLLATKLIIDLGSTACDVLSVVVVESMPLSAENHVSACLGNDCNHMVVAHLAPRECKVHFLIDELIEIAVHHLHKYAVVDAVEVEREQIAVEMLAHGLTVIDKPRAERLEVDFSVELHDIPDVVVVGFGLAFLHKAVKGGVSQFSTFIGREISKFAVRTHIDAVAVGEYRAHYLYTGHRNALPAVAVEAQQSGVVAYEDVAIFTLGAAPVLKSGVIVGSCIAGDDRHERCRPRSVRSHKCAYHNHQTLQGSFLAS